MLDITPLHPTFMGEVTDIDLRSVNDSATLQALRDAMDQFAVLVFRNQQLNDDEHMAFAQRMDVDGQIHAKTGSRVIAKSRLGNEALTDISNLDPDGNPLETNDRRRLYGLANRMWHTDASFEDPPGRYSMLFAYVIPPVAADTQYCDMRSAYDALDDETKMRIQELKVHHSIAYSRQTLGFEFSEEEAAALPGAVHPLVRDHPNVGRKSLYLASHASRVIDWPVPEGRMLLRELMEHATQSEFVHGHAWREGDLVIWDNRATMHRATPFDDQKHRRELRRVTTLDIAS